MHIDFVYKTCHIIRIFYFKKYWKENMETRGSRTVLAASIREQGEAIGLEGDGLIEYCKAELEKIRLTESEERMRRIQLQSESEERIRIAEINARQMGERQGDRQELRQNSNYHLMKNLRYDEDKDLDEFIVKFEHIATQVKIPKEEWVPELQSRLTGKLQSFLMTEDIRLKQTDYDSVKLLLLKHAGYNAEKYRALWNKTTPVDDDFRAFHSNLVRSLNNWVASTNTEKTYEGLKDLVCLDRLLANMNTETVRTVLLLNPRTCEEVLSHIDSIKASSGLVSLSRNIPLLPYVAGSADSWGSPVRQFRSRSVEQRQASRCFHCGMGGHRRSECRELQGSTTKSQAGQMRNRGRELLRPSGQPGQMYYKAGNHTTR